jgi:hypothetical protein
LRLKGEDIHIAGNHGLRKRERERERRGRKNHIKTYGDVHAKRD